MLSLSLSLRGRALLRGVWALLPPFTAEATEGMTYYKFAPSLHEWNSTFGDEEFYGNVSANMPNVGSP